jgi:hypothetical protein
MEKIFNSLFIFVNNNEKAVYQVSTFLGKSSVRVVPVKKLWILPLLQIINFVVLFLHAIFHFIPSVWFVFVIIFWEGYTFVMFSFFYVFESISTVHTLFLSLSLLPKLVFKKLCLRNIDSSRALSM